MLAAWLTLRPPRRAATRHLLCLAALAAGVLLPVAPRWGNAVVPWPRGGASGRRGGAIGVGRDGPSREPAAEAASSPAADRADLTAIGPTKSPPRPGPAPVSARPDPVRPTTTSLAAGVLAALAAAVAWAAVVWRCCPDWRAAG